MALSNQMIDVLTFIEQVFYEKGQLPTDELVIQECEIAPSTLTAYWKSDDFRLALGARGISLNNIKDRKTLTYIQLKVANMLMNTLDKRSMREKLKDLKDRDGTDVSVTQVNAWMRQPAFQDHMTQRGKGLFDGAEGTAYRGLVGLVEQGDLRAIQLYFEMRGIYNPRVQHEIKIDVVLIRVVEIISTYVRDPAILDAIAHDIEALVAPPSLEHALPVGQ